MNQSVADRRRFWFFVLLAVVVIGVVTALILRYAAAKPNLVTCPPECPYTFQTPSIFTPSSEEAIKIRDLFNFIMILAAVVFVVVEGALVYAIYKFRNRPPESALQISGDTRLEIAWTAAPAIILMVILGFTLRTMAETRAPATGDFIKVKAIGHQYWWEFQYPAVGLITASELVVPVNTTIEVEMESADVEHGLWAPELFGKIDAIPGYTTRLRFTPTTIGKSEYGGQCTQFCGVQHGQMRFAVIVVSRADYDAWLTAQLKPAEAPTAAEAVAGLDAFTKQGCVACHSIDGNPTAVGKIGPNLTHLMARSFIAGGVLHNTPENLKAWISTPQQVKPGSLMVVNTSAMTEQVTGDIVAYLMTLK